MPFHNPPQPTYSNPTVGRHSRTWQIMNVIAQEGEEAIAAYRGTKDNAAVNP